MQHIVPVLLSEIATFVALHRRLPAQFAYQEVQMNKLKRSNLEPTQWKISESMRYFLGKDNANSTSNELFVGGLSLAMEGSRLPHYIKLLAPDLV